MKKQKKVPFTIRISPYAKKYLKKKKISGGQIFKLGFERQLENDKKYNLKQFTYFKNKLNDKKQKYNEIKELFIKQCRGAEETKRFDISWLEAKVEKLNNEGISIDVKELYEYCIKPIANDGDKD